ncbi:MAG: VOC family protein [Bryobacterales bacterium]|nr:VOC family protein [Bryobacterales bacterium]
MPQPSHFRKPERQFHHTGFVVASIEQSLPGFAAALGASWVSEVTHDTIQRVRVVFLGEGPDTLPQVELVEPVGASSPVGKFLEKGGGLHHICQMVRHLDDELLRQKELGSTLVRRPQPAAAFGGRRIAWIFTPERLLVELLEEEHSVETGVS